MRRQSTTQAQNFRVLGSACYFAAMMVFSVQVFVFNDSVC